jgi:hypothetical protein
MIYDDRKEEARLKVAGYKVRSALWQFEGAVEAKGEIAGAGVEQEKDIGWGDIRV